MLLSRFPQAREAEVQAQLRLTAPLEAQRQQHFASLKALKTCDLRDKLEAMGAPAQGKKAELISRIVELTPDDVLREALTSSEEGCAEGGVEGGAEGGGDGFRVPADPLAPLEAEMLGVLRTEPLLNGAEGGGGGGGGGAGGEGGQAGGGADEGVPSALWLQNDMLESRNEDMSEEAREEMMAELNADLEQLDEEVECYLIKDAEEVPPPPPPESRIACHRMEWNRPFKHAPWRADVTHRSSHTPTRKHRHW